MTVFGCALALERNPPAAAAIRAVGLRRLLAMAGAGCKHFELSEAEEREHIRKAITSLEKTVGERPLGWYCRYGPSVNTRRLVVEEGGFLYDSDYYGEELPFWQTVDGKPHLVVPYSLTNNDGKYAAWIGTLGPVVRLRARRLRHALRGRRDPAQDDVGRLHMRLIGHPARAAGLQRLLDHIQKHDASGSPAASTSPGTGSRPIPIRARA